MQMCKLLSVSAACLVVFLAVVILPPPSAAQARLDIFVTPVPNAPFNGTINVERSTVMPDGSIVQLKTVRDIHRDSKGRIYNEMRTLLPAASTATPQVVGILLYDPQTRVSTHLDPKRKTFANTTVNRPPETVPPVFNAASPSASSLPMNEFTKQEDLGNREMDGVPVHGIRETQTIPAESSSTGHEVTVTDEYWYSAELRINMVLKHNDPRTGSVTMTVTGVTRTEPDPALLQIPEGYLPAGAVREAKQQQPQQQQ
jgi:hypothetical protein